MGSFLNLGQTVEKHEEEHILTVEDHQEEKQRAMGQSIYRLPNVFSDKVGDSHSLVDTFLKRRQHSALGNLLLPKW